MTLESFYALTLAVGVLAYAALTVFCIVTWVRGITGRAAFLAAAVTLFYLLSIGLTGFSALTLTLEVATLLAWMLLLIRVIGVGHHNVRDPALRPVVMVFATAALLALLTAGYAWALALGTAFAGALPRSGFFIGELLLAIGGLVLLEQVVRNTREDLRWRLRYLNIAVGTLFTFQLLHNACGLLFNAYTPSLVVIQPAVFALATPFIAIASVRNARNRLKLNLSRRFVFRSGILIGTGLLLLSMGLLGYLVRAFDGDWGAAAMALALAVAAVTGVAVAGSTEVRVRVRRWFEEHLFAQKYDYREEWRRVTRQLTEPSPDYDLPQQVLRALARVLETNGGALWWRTPQDLLVPLNQLHTSWNAPLAPDTSARLSEFFENREWVLDLERLPEPAVEVVDGCPDLRALPGVRFVVPLMSESRLMGVAALAQPHAPLVLEWEDYDVLKLIARQGAGFVALREAERELADADKLNSFSQVSAFIVHDVKTISSQLSLLLENAEKHKTNPAFVDDMLTTVGNAVERMRKLLAQLREGEAGSTEVVALHDELRALVDTFARQHPAPRLEAEPGSARVAAEPSKLRSAIGHLVQNAIDAAAGNGAGACREPAVQVRLREHPPWAEIDIEDSGPGMAPEFVESSLFQPFTSTKGVAGMGVGAYQARAYVRALGGDIVVDSHPGNGSRFTIRLPMQANP
ncbi:MAG: XrtA/PEP-CTERM system histidine kinase PrsK [Pseudomonadota bacterium]